jgi:hypothetical protein
VRLFTEGVGLGKSLIGTEAGLIPKGRLVTESTEANRGRYTGFETVKMVLKRGGGGEDPEAENGMGTGDKGVEVASSG